MTGTPFRGERAETFFDKKDLFLNLFSPIPYKIRRIKKIIEFNDVVIFGAPGTGKSSILRILCWDMLIKIKNEHFQKDYDEFRELLGLNDENLPFFAFYINLNKEFEDGFYAKDISDDDWKKIYLYYFCLLVIDRFLENLDSFDNRFFEKRITWFNNIIPNWIKNFTNLRSLYNEIKLKIGKIHQFLNGVYKDYQKFEIELVQREFFSETINDIIKSIESPFKTIFIILDDFSSISVNLMPIVLNFLGKREPNIFIKIGSRLSPALNHWPGKDRRDVTIVDLDYEFINTKKQLFRSIVSDIAVKRLVVMGNKIATSDFEKIFGKLNPIEEAKIYDKNITIDNDTFIEFLKKWEKSNLIDADYIELFNFFHNREIEPLHRKLIEILVTRDIRNLVLEISKPLIIEFFNEKLNEIDKHKELNTIALHLLAREANTRKIYSGYNSVWRLSSYVFQNFLYILEKILEEYSYQESIAKPVTLIRWQIINKVIHELSEEYSEEILERHTEYGPDIKFFIKFLAIELLDQFAPQASFRDGRTGFGINRKYYYIIMKNDVIKEAVRYSYLQIKSIRKGLVRRINIPKKTIVFYINRLLLPYMSFPLRLGGYRDISYDNIMKLVDNKQIRHPEQRTLLDYIESE